MGYKLDRARERERERERISISAGFCKHSGLLQDGAP